MSSKWNRETTYGELVPGDVVVYEADRDWRGKPRTFEVVRVVNVYTDPEHPDWWLGEFDNGSTVATTTDAQVRVVGHVTVGV